MAKKDRRQSGNRGKGLVIWIVTGIALVIIILAFSGKIPPGKEEKNRSFLITEKETKHVLDPSLFTGRTRMAYAAAKQYPDAMNEVFCYCYCDQHPFNHKTLLSCFTDDHGVG